MQLAVRPKDVFVHKHMLLVKKGNNLLDVCIKTLQSSEEEDLTFEGSTDWAIRSLVEDKLWHIQLEVGCKACTKERRGSGNFQLWLVHPETSSKRLWRRTTLVCECTEAWRLQVAATQHGYVELLAT